MSLGSHEVDYAHHHGAVAEGCVLDGAVQNRSSRLIQNRGRGLIHLSGSRWIARGRRLREIRELRAIGLIPGEIISGKQHPLQSGMIGVDASIYVRDDSAAG